MFNNLYDKPLTMSAHVPAPTQDLSSYSPRGSNDASHIPSSGLGSQVRAYLAAQTCLLTTARWGSVRLFPAGYSIPRFCACIPCSGCTCQIPASHNSGGLLRNFLRRVLFDTRFLWSQKIPTTPGESVHPAMNSSPPMRPQLPAIWTIMVVANLQCLTGKQGQ
jgi:hypothetical protein